MSVTRPFHLAIGGLAAGLLATGTVALTLVGGAGHSGTASAGRAGVASLAGAVGADGEDGDDGVAAAAGASLAAASGSTGSGAEVGAAPGAKAAGVAGDARVSGAAARRSATTSAGAAVGAGSGGSTPGAGRGSGTNGTGGSGGGPASGGGPGGGDAGHGDGGGSSPGVGTPSVPAVPSGGSLHAEGSLVVAVPPTAGMSKKLCLSGEVDRCQVITLPATPGRTLRVSYSGNASTEAPTMAVSPCQGGTGITVSGITPGTTVTVDVEGRQLSRTLGSRELSQTASLCDA